MYYARTHQSCWQRYLRAACHMTIAGFRYLMVIDDEPGTYFRIVWYPELMSTGGLAWVHPLSHA